MISEPELKVLLLKAGGAILSLIVLWWTRRIIRGSYK